MKQNRVITIYDIYEYRHYPNNHCTDSTIDYRFEIQAF